MTRPTLPMIALLVSGPLFVVPTTVAGPMPATRTFAMATSPAADAWADACRGTDPTAPLLAQFRREAGGRAVTATGLRRADYLRLIAGNVEVWKAHQNVRGAIIDPCRGVEWHHSRPCDALAAVTRVDPARRTDLPESADRVPFRLVDHADFGGPTSVAERYGLTPEGVVCLPAELSGHTGPTRMIVPLLAKDGVADSSIKVEAGRVIVRPGSEAQSFAARGATTVSVADERQAFRNGRARPGTARCAGDRA